MNAHKTICDRLEERHREDRLVFECKNGPTHGAMHLRMDAWAMKCSWSNPLTYGYEIKVSRNDFLRDDKWHRYLDYCNEFSFVCPHGLIQPEELPEKVGLLWLAKTGGRLFAKRKAVRREVEIPEELWRYIIMCRARIGEEYQHDPRSKWREFVDQKTENRYLGAEVSRAIRDRVAYVEAENRRLSDENQKAQTLFDEIRKLGINPNDSRYRISARLRAVKSGVPDGFDRDLRSLRSQIDHVLSALEEVEELAVVS